MPVTAELFEPRRQGLMTARQLRDAGVGPAALWRATAAGDVTRLRRNVYALTPLPPLPKFVVTDSGVAPSYVQHVRAALLSCSAGATARGRTAAALRGWGLLVEPARTIELAVPHGSGRVHGRHLAIHQRRRLRRERYVALPGTEAIWLTTSVQTVIACCLTLPLIEAVVVCDSALRAGDVTLNDLRRAARRQPGVPEAEQVRRVLRLTDPESGSVLESVLRVRMRLAGIAGFSSQVIVHVAGGIGHRVDFCFADHSLVIEVDGAKWHPNSEPDRIRDNGLAAAGFRVLRYSWADVVHDAPRVLAEISAALAAGSSNIQFRPQATRAAA